MGLARRGTGSVRLALKNLYFEIAAHCPICETCVLQGCLDLSDFRVPGNRELGQQCGSRTIENLACQDQVTSLVVVWVKRPLAWSPSSKRNVIGSEL